MNTPDNNGALPGQLDIEGQIAEEENGRARQLGLEAPEIEEVPANYLSCGRKLSLEHGWAYSKNGPPTIQCPNCAARYTVPAEAHAAYREAVRARYAAMKPLELPKKRGARRVRGTE